MEEILSSIMDTIYGVIDFEFLGNTVLQYLTSIGIFIGLVILIIIFHKIVFKKLKKSAEDSESALDDRIVKLIKKNLIPLLYFGSFYIAVMNLTLSETVNTVFSVAGTLLLVVLLIRFTVTILRYILKHNFVDKEPDTVKASSIRALLPIINIIVWGLGIIFLLDNMGFNISAIVTGLGIGGIAIALAAQSILGDLFSYFCILFDRPFNLGDFIIIDEFLGVVEYIGIKTTRIRSLSGEILVFSNTELTGKPIRNFRHMKSRRIAFKFGILYQTENDQMKKIPDIVKDIIEGIELTRFDRAHFNNFGNSSLDYEVVYYIDSPDYNTYMDIQQEINLKLKKELESIGVDFAYPTHTIFIEKNAAPSA
jgi:small-conductance mechanosensitive channel